MVPNDLSASDEKYVDEVKEEKKELIFEGPEDELLACPKCNHFITGNDINVESTIAKCSHCDHVFAFAHDSASRKLKPQAIIPKGVEMLKLRSELDIRLKWTETTSRGGQGFIILFTTVWNLILLPFVVMAVVSGTWGILLFLSAHLTVGLGLLWHLATIYFNQTSISVTKERIRIKTLPLKSLFWKSREVHNSDISQLYVSKYVQSTSNGVLNYAYALYAILRSGEKISLVRGMNRETQRYVEREVEEFLGIKNRKVPEETS